MPFDSLEMCIGAVPLILKSNLKPVAVEFMQREVIWEAEKYLGKGSPIRIRTPYLLLSFDGDTRGEVEALCDRAAELCLRVGAKDAFYADTAERLSSLWDARGAFLEAIKNSTTQMDECDVVVPRKRIAEFVRHTNLLEEKHGIRIRYFGHAGTKHPCVCVPGRSAPGEWSQKLRAVMEELYQKAEELEGKVSEHGVGHAKIGFLRESEGRLYMAMMGKIKRAFDPNLILNPGKVVGMPL